MRWVALGSVHAITRRVVQQVAAGAPIEQVILREHLGSAPAQSLLVKLADMQAWVSGAINDDQYRARWCCTILQPSSVRVEQVLLVG